MRKATRVIFYSLLVISFILLLNRLFLIFSYNLDLGGLENYFAFLALKVGSGEMYTHPEKYPFMVTQYPPLYLVLNHYLADVFNLYYKDMVRSIYVSGRLLNLIFNLVTIGVIFRFFRLQLKFTAQQSAIPALIIFTLFIEHAYAVRMDSLKMLLVTCFYIVGYQYLKDSKAKSLLIVVIVGFLAMIAKHDAALHVIVLGFVFFSQKRFLNAFKFGVPIAASFFGFGIVICGGSWEIFYQNFIVGISQGVDFYWANMVFKWNPFAMIAQLIMVVTLLIWGFRNKKKQWYLPTLIAFLFVFASFNILKWGSNFNYYFEFQILTVALFTFWSVQEKSKLLSIVFYSCVVIFLLNNIWNKNLGIVEQQVKFSQWKKEYENFKVDANGLNLLLQKEEASKVIVFSRPLSLMMYNQVVLGTTANEYPEWQFPYVKTLPRRTYDYHLACNGNEINQIRFITWNEVDEFHKKLLFEMFDTNIDLELELTQSNGKYNFYKLSCLN